MKSRTKAILITGASRGIGRATALLAGQRGWSVGVNYLSNEAMAKRTVQDVHSAGGRAVAIQGSVTSEQDIIEMFDVSEKSFGKLDGVVVNAGIVAPSMKLVDMSVERLENMLKVNVLGAMLCAREAAKRLIKNEGKDSSSIVFVSSAASRIGSPFEYIDYASSKGAVDTLSLGLSKELVEHNIRVNSVRPGIIATDIHASAGRPDRAQEVGSQMPMGRPGTADEVAEAIMWLLSDASSYTTGTNLDVAGGR